jgi:hypothetical protein
MAGDHGQVITVTFLAAWRITACLASALLGLTTYQYLNATIQTNRDPPVSYAGQYSTDVIAEKTLG